MAKHLILIPTAMERELLETQLELPKESVQIELCGFGMVAAAARSAALLAAGDFDEVLLLGIAGAYDDQLSLGEAFEFSRVHCYGIGVGSGSNYQSAGELGWSHWGKLSDSLELAGAGPELLTVTAASANVAEAAERQNKFPDAAAEDMEGFGVALACQMRGKPLRILRGISNAVGKRDKTDWQIGPSLEALAKLVNEQFAR